MSKPRGIDRNYLADCLRRIPSYQIYTQSTFATGVPDRTSAPASGSALPRISILPRRQYQLLGAKVRLAALLGHGSDLSMFGQCAPAVRCCPHTGSAPQRGSYYPI